MSKSQFLLLLGTILCLAACKPRQVAGNDNNAKGLDLDKVLDNCNAHRLQFKILTFKGKADFEDLSKGSSIGFSYRIDIAKDSLILINVSKFGIPAMNMLISHDTIKLRMPINQTAMICDFGLLQKTMKIDLDFVKFQAVLLGEAVLSQPITLTSIKGQKVELQGSRPPYSVDWILNANTFRLEKMRMEDTNLGTKSEISYDDFQKE